MYFEQEKEYTVDVDSIKVDTQTQHAQWKRDADQKSAPLPSIHAMPLPMQVHGAHPESLSAGWCAYVS
jgi:hypothetical protein